MKLITITLISTLLFISCSDGTENENNAEPLNTVNVEKVEIDSIEKEKQLEKDKIRLTELKSNFIYIEDEFNGNGWYIHNNQNREWYRNGLFAIINNDGYIYLEDQFYYTEWIFHTQVLVKIGDTIYESEIIPRHSENNITEVDNNGNIRERIQYISNKDNGIIEAISKTENGDVIKIRYTGGGYYYDFTLNEKDRIAIKEAFELSQILKRI